MFATQNIGHTTEFYYGIKKGGCVNHLEFYGVKNFRSNRTKCLQRLISITCAVKLFSKVKLELTCSNNGVAIW